MTGAMHNMDEAEECIAKTATLLAQLITNPVRLQELPMHAGTNNVRIAVFAISTYPERYGPIFYEALDRSLQAAGSTLRVKHDPATVEMLKVQMGFAAHDVLFIVGQRLLGAEDHVFVIQHFLDLQHVHHLTVHAW